MLDEEMTDGCKGEIMITGIIATVKKQCSELY
jgi:hypothetical protein